MLAAPGPINRRELLRLGVLVASTGAAALAAACGGAPASPTAAPKAAEPTKPAAPAATATPAPAAKPAEPTKPAAAPTAAPAAATKPAAAAPAGAGKPGGKITWAIESDPVNLIPYGGISTSNMWGKEFMYDSLLEWDRDLKVQPALAEEYTTPDDKTYLFKIRKGVKFHDGKELDAEDVKYSLEAAANPQPPGIKIAQYPKIASIDVVDKYTVKFNMSQPDPTVPGFLAWARYSPIIPKGAYDPAKVLTSGIGTGPFKLVEFVGNDRVVYTRNPNFWKQGLPYLDDLTLKVLPDEQARVAALRSGAIDGCTVSADVARTLRNDRNLTVLKGLTSAPRVLQFTLKGDGKPWNDKRVRQAISMAINRQEIIDKVYGGEAVLTGPIPPGYGDWFIPPEELAAKWFKHDLEGAKQLLAQTPYKDGFAIELQAIAAPPDYTRNAEVVKEQLKPLKIDVKVVPLEIGTFAKNIGDGNYEWGSTGRGMRGDPSGYVVDFRPPPNNPYFTAWKNDELMKLYDEALVTIDPAKRKPMYRKIQELILEEAPHIYLVQNYKFHVVRSHLKNMYVSFTDFHTGLREAWIEK
jgi:peptide/nickel transport system substrate-binding protein